MFASTRRFYKPPRSCSKTSRGCSLIPRATKSLRCSRVTGTSSIASWKRPCPCRRASLAPPSHWRAASEPTSTAGRSSRPKISRFSITSAGDRLTPVVARSTAGATGRSESRARMSPERRRHCKARAWPTRTNSCSRQASTSTTYRSGSGEARTVLGDVRARRVQSEARPESVNDAPSDQGGPGVAQGRPVWRVPR